MRKGLDNAACWVFLVLCGACLAVGCGDSRNPNGNLTDSDTEKTIPVPESDAAQETGAKSTSIVSAARNQVGKTTIYDSSYVRLDYPGGDIPIERGVCTDVVIRALRDSVKMDLQQLLHEDMNGSFSDYPNVWGLKKPDRNIDHRRVLNLRRFFERQGYSLEVTRKKEHYRAGDLVTCTVPPSRPHIMIVSDKNGQDGVPWVIHNIGSGAKEEERLFEFPITGHYRIRKMTQRG